MGQSRTRRECDLKGCEVKTSRDRRIAGRVNYSRRDGLYLHGTCRGRGEPHSHGKRQERQQWPENAKKGRDFGEQYARERRARSFNMSSTALRAIETCLAIMRKPITKAHIYKMRDEMIDKLPYKVVVLGLGDIVSATRVKPKMPQMIGALKEIGAIP